MVNYRLIIEYHQKGNNNTQVAKWAVLPIYCVYGERKRKNVFGTEQNLLSLIYGKRR